ncbi:MAG: S9 family peptidase [Chitinophagaceae bacterium]|nr:S9 family peptidase [Chitinophagaceae bacterium]
MRKALWISIILFLLQDVYAQKKPLDHTVYDSWQHIGERMISNDGKWVVYTIDPQQGDNELVIQSSDAKFKKAIPRGYSAAISEDSRFVVFKIKPLFKDTRDARIKKKKQEDFPKDSLCILELGKEEIWKKERIKSYQLPKDGYGWVAYLSEKEDSKPKKGSAGAGAKTIDSLNQIIDSLRSVIRSIPEKNDEDVLAAFDIPFADESPVGSSLVLRNLLTGEQITFNQVLEYKFSDDGSRMLISYAKDPDDSTAKNGVSLYYIKERNLVQLSIGGNDFKSFSFSRDGSQLAYLAERDAGKKDLQKFYGLWYYKAGMDSAGLLVDRSTTGMMLGMTVSEFGNVSFSKSGQRIFFGSAEIKPPKDTTLIEFEHAKLDIWHYNDDYLQTVQTTPARLRAAQQENFLTVYDLNNKSIQQLESKEIPQVIPTSEGDGEIFVGVTDYGQRVEGQWLGTTKKNIYAIHVNTGEKQLIRINLHGQVYPSSTGKYVMWYDRKAKNYFAWDGKEINNITEKIHVPLYEEDWDTPDDPQAYGIMGWHEGDSAVYIYDRYNIWVCDPEGVRAPSTVYSGTARSNKWAIRYLRTDPEEKVISKKSNFLFRIFDENNKYSSVWYYHQYFDDIFRTIPEFFPTQFGQIIKSKNSNNYIYTMEDFSNSPDLYLTANIGDYQYNKLKLSSINPQQKDYNWGTAELFKWKAYTGKESTGIVYKPENFDPKKKYPVIVYFYEKLSNNLYDYKEPAPIRSAVNVPYFVSNGYIIFMPDIEYKTGYPGQGAYDYIVSGARALAKNSWVDSTNMALQGHSWGGYQAAQLATMTTLFKAVWSGAPVSNMTSAYGGIRWASGLNRQFQYEKTQSRIGATLWERPDLYILNSPLFHLDKVTAPMVILHNDNDGAVPWYQGIELFTALRRLGKKVWMLNYNGEGHGLTERQDMMDYQIRMQQFFDWILKGEKPAKWITEGVPAVNKGKDWGLEVE